MTTHPSTERLRAETERLRADLLDLTDRFAKRSGMADSGISRAVFGPLGDKDFVKRLRAGNGFQADKAERLERYLRAALSLRGADFETFVEQARVSARLPQKRALVAAE